MELPMKIKDFRLYFEPKPGVCVNHNDMFKHYVLNWLDGFDVDFGGYIAMNSLEKEYGKGEPVYQVILRNPTPMSFGYLNEYIDRNPLHGYVVHRYVKSNNDVNLRKM